MRSPKDSFTQHVVQSFTPMAYPLSWNQSASRYAVQYKHLGRNHHTLPNPLARGIVDLGALIDGVSSTPWVMHAFRGARDWLDWGSAVEIDVYTTSLGETSHAAPVACPEN
jgi:hypothetical protein